MPYFRSIGEAVQARDEALKNMRSAHEAIERANPDTANVDELQRRFDDAKRAHEAAAQQVETMQARAALPVPAVLDTAPALPDARSKGPHVRITRENLTYEPWAADRSFFRDAYAARSGDPDALQRIVQHNREMQIEGRALTSTDGAGGEFVPPIWISDQWVSLARYTRPVANSFTQLALPPAGDTVNLPRVATGSTVATQQDGGSVSSTDPTTDAVTANVVTIAGQVDLSRQSWERSAPGLDQVLSDDLGRAYHAKVEQQVVNGTGSAGQALGLLNVSGINAVTYTSGTPTVANLYTKIGDATQRIAAAIYQPATAVAMAARRFQWIASATDSQGRPLMTPVGPQNTVGAYNAPTGEGPAGTIQGLPALISPAISLTSGAGTNQDTVIVYRPEECFLWENPAGPAIRVFEDVLSGTGQVRVQTFGYVAAMPHRRPTSISVISGTGLAAPTW